MMNFSRVAKKYVPEKNEIVHILKEEIKVRGDNKIDSTSDFFDCNKENNKLRTEILSNFSHIDVDDYIDSLIKLYENDEEVRELINSLII